MISRSGLSSVFIIMAGALSALLMIALSANALLELGKRVASTPPHDILWPALVVLALIVVPGLVQGLFVGSLCREHRVHYATLSSLIAACLFVVSASAILRHVQFGAEIPGTAAYIALAALGLLFCALFVLAARLGGHIAYIRARSRTSRGQPPMDGDGAAG